MSPDVANVPLSVAFSGTSTTTHLEFDVDLPQTLHDFTLNLLSDPDARSAFQLDPQGSLDSAGLGDVHPADIQELLPLVLDFAPVTSLGDFGSAISGLDLDQQLDLMSTLQNTTGQQVDDNTVLGAVSGLTAAVHGVTTGFDVLGDPSTALDVVPATEITDVTKTVTDLEVTDTVGNLSNGTDVLDTTHVTDVVGDVTGNTHTGDLGVEDVLSGDITSAVGNVTGNDLSLEQVGNVGDVVSQAGNLGDVTGVGHVGDIGKIGDISGELGDVNVGGVLNDLDLSL
ncbi:IniB N-terminal domain-containing protein [Lentzea sp. NEAU-D7]|uniref:IniB N-terminal domain-containing protein n=1 Tax=Lentzea sp. NEAU-D7 TaxID=2994667 RepID=UPI00224AF10A|nr:IniB N-terminal domain-containing protein [Lentzea sp. NEAU-D7]MCX2953643.1 IniB N-terminal domain-containing protein [Lentzea sp. NEAU-D7]